LSYMTLAGSGCRSITHFLFHVVYLKLIAPAKCSRKTIKMIAPMTTIAIRIQWLKGSRMAT